MAVANANMFPNFLDNSPSSANLAALPRQSPLPIAQHQVNAQVNGAGMNGMNGMNVALPMNAGHQMDLNVLFTQVEELSQLLRENREKTQEIIASAEELAVSCACYPLVRLLAAFAALVSSELWNRKSPIDCHVSESRYGLGNSSHFGASQQRNHEYGISFHCSKYNTHILCPKGSC